MIRQKELFTSGQGGYHTFRIPALLVTREGTVLAFCEARRNGQGDAGDIDVVLRRSEDGGETWGPLQVIADDGADTIGNPCPVQDRETGTIWLIVCKNAEEGHEKDILAGQADREVLKVKSDDDGRTWSPLENISKSVKHPDWSWYATGPGHGIQLKSGRLVVPCNHAVFQSTEGRSGPYISHIVYSDDHGESWRIGEDVGEHTNECSVAELPDEALYLTMRSYHGQNRRAFSWSLDGGISWSSPELDRNLIDPVCQGSVVCTEEGIVLFSNCASEKREKLTLRFSADRCQTWNVLEVLHEGPAAYSDLALTRTGAILCLFECGEKKPYEKIVLAKVKM
ncbi:sialidase family protein [Paenibacillus sp. GYB003]|uniref:sialidase family protein n=1 Tax=Paenibacillus sp. GYB003 TaxID=2994392 RepID=UPI002F9666B2